MHLTRRITTSTFGTLALTAALLLGTSACNPSKGQADITASGWINGSANGPKVTCTSTSRINTRTWTGSLGGRKNVEVSFKMDKVTGRDRVQMSWSIPGGAEGVATGDDKDIVSVDSSKVARFSGKIGKDSMSVTLTAALVCP